jgi:hypothetical protein
MSLADDLLPPCTVRIGVRKSHSGSGFFVTPRLIATCAHVIPSSSDPRQPADASELAVEGLDGGSHEVEVKEFDADVDLALLRVSSTASHPCVLLDAAPIISRDRMHTFAYPEGHTEGVPRTLEAEGRTGAHRWIFKGDQIQRGMSGSPLLNLRTGGVSGVINRTKGKSTDFGGYAIPISDLLKLGKTVRSANENYHECSSEWYDALNAEQKVGWHMAHARAASEVRSFVIAMDEKDDGWQVTADDPEGRQLDPVRVDLNAVKTEVARLFRDWAARGRLNPEEQTALLGQILFSAAFPGAIGERLGELFSDESGGRVLVCLKFDETPDRQLSELPWESLRFPAPHDVNLATDAKLSVVRLTDRRPDLSIPGPATQKLKVLAAFVGLSSDKQDDVNTLKSRLTRASNAEPGFNLVPLVHPDINELEEKLYDTKPDILHYIGLGQFTETKDRFALAEEPGLQFYDIDELVELLPDPVPKLVILQQYTAPPSAAAADFSVLAPPLLEAGVAAVIGFQVHMDAFDISKFNDELYRQLSTGELVEFAVQAAREKLKRQPRAFPSPAVFVRKPGQLILAIPSRSGGADAPGAFKDPNG